MTTDETSHRPNVVSTPMKVWFLAAWEQWQYCIIVFLRVPYYFVKKYLLRQETIWGERLLMRWGVLPRELLRVVQRGNVVWLNALSGGEVTQIVTFCKLLKEELPDHTIVLSTNNDYAASFARKNIPWLDYVFDTPWDIQFICHRVLSKIRPVTLLFVENVYSPILARAARRKGVKTLLISGLVNPEFGGHPIYQRAFRLGFQDSLQFAIVKSEEDRATLIESFGVAPERTVSGGNLKFDLEYLHVPAEVEAQLRSNLGLSGVHRFVVLAGSTHEGEAELILECIGQVQQGGLRPMVIIAPRYTHTIPEVTQKAQAMGLQCILRSSIQPDVPLSSDVVVVDTFGELARMYSVADAVILGGTFFRRWKVGFGQNIIEPLASRKPIFFGPYVSQFRDITERLKTTWPNLEVRDSDELAHSLRCLMTDPALMQKVVSAETDILEENRDSAQRHVRLISEQVRK